MNSTVDPRFTYMTNYMEKRNQNKYNQGIPQNIF